MIFNLDGVVKHYDWGKKGNQSLVCKYYYANKKDINTKLLKCYNIFYAELWIGTHERGTSNVLNSNLSIKEIISKYVSDNTFKNHYKNDLPFMVKLISIGKPLSIQVHPDKNKASYLHFYKPLIYPDPNHKHEMAIALSDNFQLLYGFDNEVFIADKFNSFPSMMKLLKIVPSFFFILDSNQLLVSRLINAIKIDLSCDIDDTLNIQKFKSLISYLIDNHDNDVGIILSFYMKHIILNKGEAISISPNILHSYLKGDIVEVMSKSDNVIRLGLTSKHIDKDTAKSIIANTNEVIVDKIKPDELLKNWLFYKCPAKEFMVFRSIKSLSNQCIENYEIPDKYYLFPLIIIVLEGYGTINNEKKK